MPPKLTPIDVERIVELYLDGTSYRAIAEKVGCSKNTAMRHINAYFAERKEERTDQVEREQQRVLARLDRAANAAWQSYLGAENDAAAARFLGEYRQAVTQYARLSGMTVTDRVEHTGRDGGPIKVEGPDPKQVLLARLEAMSPQPLAATDDTDG